MYLLLLHAIPEMIRVNGSEEVKMFFYFSSTVFYLHCPTLYPVTSTATGVSYVLLFRDQWTSTATVGSAALQQLHICILLWNVSPLYQNMPTYAESNLSHHRYYGQLHHETGLAGIMLQISVTIKNPSKASRITPGN